MKKFNFFLTTLFTAVMLMGSTSVWGQATVNSSLYEETFGTFGSGNSTFAASTMSSYDKSGTTMLVAADKSSLVFSGANAMYSTGTGTNMTSGHVWLNKNTTGYIQIAGIPVYNASKIKVSFSQGGAGNVDVYADFGSGATKIGGSTAAGATIETSATSVTGTTLTLKLQRQSNSNNLRIDNIKVIVTEVVSSCTASNLAFADPTVNKSVVDSKFTIAATSLNGTTDIVYSSTNPSVATVDAETGEVEIVGAGTTTIKADQDAGTHNSTDYCVGSAEYDLTVTAPTITVLPTSLNFSKTLGALTPAEDLIEVTGANLTADIIVGITGTDAALFDVDVSTISMSGGSASDVLVVTYTPTALGSHTATLTLSSAGAADKTVALSGTAALVTPVATAASSIGGTGFTANWEAVTGAESYVLNVYTKESSLISDVTVVGWDFEDQNATADLGISDNLNKTISTNATGLTYSTLSGASGYVAQTSSGGWNSGSDTKNWQVSFTTINISNMKFSSVQRSSNTGPRDFKVQYSLNGSDWTDIAGSIITVANDWTTGILTDIVLPVACDNQTLVYLRWIMTSNTGVNGSPVAAAGTSAIDNIVVKGDSEGLVITSISGSPFTVAAPAVSRAITGLTNDKMYFYTVKAVDGSFESALSNEVGPIELTSTGVNNATALSGIAIQNGNLLVSATAGTLIEVYNIAGQKIVSQTAKEGVNTIAIAQRGAMIVKIGTETVKVVF